MSLKQTAACDGTYTGGHLATLPSLICSVLSLAYLQVLRHYSNIEEDATICPSWCLTVSLRAHTYEAEREHFIPQYILDVPKVCNRSTFGSLQRCLGFTSEVFILFPIVPS